MRKVFAIDPGTTESGWAIWDGKKLHDKGVADNSDLLLALNHLGELHQVPTLAVEMFASYGKPVGREVFETCVYIGRLLERWSGRHRLVFRRDVKLHLCDSVRVKDASVRMALIDRFGVPGTKKHPGPLYGVKSHIWSALAIAVYAVDNPDPAFPVRMRS